MVFTEILTFPILKEKVDFAMIKKDICSVIAFLTFIG